MDAGLKACLDYLDFVPGRDLIQEMTRAGQESLHTLCVITPDYLAGNRLAQFEALQRRSQDPAGIDGSLIPFILREVPDLPPWIHNLVPVQWTDPKSHSQEWKRLLTALCARQIDSPPPPAIGDASDQRPRTFRSLTRPNVQGPADLPDLARYNFDCTAFKYFKALGVGKAMQVGNAKRLVELFCNALAGRGALERPKKPESWLDAGCGTGLVTMMCLEHRELPAFECFEQCDTRIGIDYAPQMLRVVEALNTEKNYTSFFEADIRWCDRAKLKQETKKEKVDLIFANNVFHWLFNEEQIQLAFCNCYQLLDNNNGCLAASIAAYGTGRLFHDSYAEECSRRLTDEQLSKWQSHIKNPIGLQRLDSIVRIARESGFKIAVAHQEYEPIEFPSTDAYVEAARSYGEEVFMAPLSSFNDDRQEDFWKSLKKNFKEKHMMGRNPPGQKIEGKYLHDQFMIYMLAIRQD